MVMVFADSFIDGGKPKYPKKITDLSQVADKPHHIMLYSVHFSMSGIRIRNLNSGDMH